MNKTESKILKINDLLAFSNNTKLQNKNIVFTNGCFDILHIGHIDYLEKASLEGDFLVVGLNSDNSVKRLKGEKRPINNQEVRSKMLAALSFVSKVIIFEEDTPYELINTLKPNVLVKGNDYLAENIVGADVVIQNGGKVITIPLVEGFSTTSLIEKIKKL